MGDLVKVMLPGFVFVTVFYARYLGISTRVVELFFCFVGHPACSVLCSHGSLTPVYAPRWSVSFYIVVLLAVAGPSLRALLHPHFVSS